MSAPVKLTAARIGDIVECHGKRCRVFKIHPFGTIDVDEIDGPGAWRISGLPMIEGRAALAASKDGAS